MDEPSLIDDSSKLRGNESIILSLIVAFHIFEMGVTCERVLARKPYTSLLADPVPRRWLACLLSLRHLEESTVEICPEVRVFNGWKRARLPIVQTSQSGIDAILCRHDRRGIE